MASKYDFFWETRTDQLRACIAEAAGGRKAEVDASEIRLLGRRASWAGSASVTGTTLVSATMAHMVSLGRVVAAAGICRPWDSETFFFSMSPSALLRVRTWSSAPKPPRFRPASDAARARANARLEDEDPLEPGEACRAIQQIVAPLPRYTSPSQVPFEDGLYFFFEVGEYSSHGNPRITRIGNHPHAPHRLVGRLRDHYRTRRDAKNGSVFRRYLGGALLRRDGWSACLEPGPGKGHWERAKLPECDACAPFEELVSERFRSSFSFACIQVDSQDLRNRLERRLIASVAQCPDCRPSSAWLGLHAYPNEVRSTGLWNAEHVYGPGIGAADLATFQALARRSISGGQDLADTLLLLPCSKAKRGDRRLDIAPASIDQFLGPEAKALLAEGRARAFTRARLVTSSEPVMALARYSGQPYATPGVVEGILEAMARRMHVVIVSGGYGLLRAEEPIHDYEAPMQRTRSIWASRIPRILDDYVRHNAIRRTFGVFSRQYAVVPDRLADEDWRAVPSFEELGRAGSAMSVVPKRVGELVLDLLAREFNAEANRPRRY